MAAPMIWDPDLQQYVPAGAAPPLAVGSQHKTPEELAALRLKRRLSKGRGGSDVNEALAKELRQTKIWLEESRKQTERVVKGAGASIEQQKVQETERQAAEKGRILSKRKVNPAWAKLSEEERRATTQIYDEKLGKYVTRDKPLIPQYITTKSRPAIVRQGEQGGKIPTRGRVQTREQQIARGESARAQSEAERAKRQKKRDIGKIDPDILRQVRETAQSQKQAEEIRGKLEAGRPKQIPVAEWNLLSTKEKTSRIEFSEQVIQNQQDYNKIRQEIIDSYSPDPMTGKLTPQDESSMNTRLKKIDDQREEQKRAEKNAVLSFDVSVDSRLGKEFGVGAAQNLLRGKQSALFYEKDTALESNLTRRKKIAEKAAEEESAEFVTTDAKDQFMAKFEEEWTTQEEVLRAAHAAGQEEEQKELEIAIANNADLQTLEKSLGSTDTITKKRANEKHAFVMDFVAQDTGDPATVIGRAMGAYESALKFGGSPKDAQIFAEIDQIITEKKTEAEAGEEQFDGTKILELAVSKFSGSVKKGKLYMESRGYLPGDISTQTEEYQKTVLGYSPEQILQTKEFNTVSDILKRQEKGDSVSIEELNYIAELEKKEENKGWMMQHRVRLENPEMSDAEIFTEANSRLEAEIEEAELAEEEKKAGKAEAKEAKKENPIDKIIREHPRAAAYADQLEAGEFTENDILGGKMNKLLTKAEQDNVLRIYYSRRGVPEEEVEGLLKETNWGKIKATLKKFATFVPVLGIGKKLLNFFEEESEEPEMAEELGEHGELGEVARPQDTKNIANDLNNPGNLTAGGLGDEFAIGYTKITPTDGNERNFLVFKTVEQGEKAMLADIKAKQAGESKYLTGKESLNDFIDTWAGKATSQGYRRTVSQALSTKLTAPFANINPNKLMAAIQKAEGFTGKLGAKVSAHKRLTQKELRANFKNADYDEQVKIVELLRAQYGVKTAEEAHKFLGLEYTE